MKTEKDLPYVLEDEFRGPNDLGECQEFGECYGLSFLYKCLSFPNKPDKIYELLIMENYLIENIDEEYFLINEKNKDTSEITKIARIKYTKPEYVHLPKEFDCGKEELILTQEEKQILNDFLEKIIIE